MGVVEEKIDVPISIEDIEKGLMQVEIDPKISVETKYSNLDVEFEQKLKKNQSKVVEDDDDFFIITEDQDE